MVGPTHETSEARYLVLHPAILCSQGSRRSKVGVLEASRASRMCNLQTAKRRSINERAREKNLNGEGLKVGWKRFMS